MCPAHDLHQALRHEQMNTKLSSFVGIVLSCAGIDHKTGVPDHHVDLDTLYAALLHGMQAVLSWFADLLHCLC